ncbi:MAG: glycoside hydrolase family 2 protein [Dysgonamonadaceae bacterium]|jgi:beta-mannosidase|nr:glycoside hydrolase family 2 protein [Dysgonamonadaceae bacterium]
MRKIFYLFMVMPFLAAAQQPVEQINLNDNWQFSQAGKNEWREAQVPGSVQRDLIRHKALPDPYYGTNEEKIQWVENENWDYKNTFTVTAEQLGRDDALLTFEGLDTHADVFLNGSMIVHAQNMFITYEKSVKDLLKPGQNNLYIRFYSPIEYLMPARITSGFEYPADNDHREEKMSVYSRKAPYHFGWDWGIRIVQMGIWRPVSLSFYDKARIDDYFVEQTSVSDQLVKINNQLEVFSVEKNPVNALVSIQYGLGNKKQTVEKEATILPGKNRLALPVEIPNPELWWPNGWGKQTLYDFTATVSINNKVVAEKSHRIGLRSIELVRRDDAKGQTFFFEVNGIPLFAKGANYIPGEILSSQQDKAYYDRLFDNTLAANMNMLRVWGGGLYEDDYFYRLADEKGILIWQDFLFGCTPYPGDDAFLANVAAEAEQNVKRIRNYACLALWCGNNEVAESLKHWGFETRVSPEVMEDFRKGYDKTFHELLPEIVGRLAPQTAYMHSSPDTLNWGRAESLARADSHYWGLWHGREPFEVLDQKIPRFMSEFGFQAFPEMKTIRTFAEEKDFDIDSDVMRIHQKSGIGNEAIKQYMDMYYHEPSNFEDFVYVGLVMQGEGMKKGLAAHRRNRPYCMGTLYWQLNDDWPVVSWSGIDYYNNWKSLHYKARDMFAPIATDVYEENGSIGFYLFSDKLSDENKLTLHIRLIDFDGKVLKNIRETVSAKANTSALVKSLPLADFASDEQQKNSVVNVRLTDKNGKQIAEENYFFFWPNKLNLPQTDVKTSVKYADGQYTLTLSSAKLAKDVFVEIPVLGARFTDNFFDLLPGEKKTIVISSPELKAADRTAITVKHLRQTY